MTARPRVLYVTDLAYEARGRRYCDEDIYLSSRLRTWFDIALCHPCDAVALMDGFDVVVVRNSGPVMGYRDDYDAFIGRAAETGARIFTQLAGKGDQAGKQYLVDLYVDGFPVIPTVDRLQDLSRLPDTKSYVVKPKSGADSIGLRVVGQDELDTVPLGYLVQPRIDFVYEVSFYFVGRELEYCLYAPDVDDRWNLQPYLATPDDLLFAQQFVDWNSVEHGIQRVDACRTVDGNLLLVELEDLNPFLSLDRVPASTRQAFVDHVADAIVSLAQMGH